MKIGLNILLILFPNLLLGQINLRPPIDTSLVFLPNIISTTNLEHSGPSINIDNNLICWSMWERPKPVNPRQIIKILNYICDTVPISIEFSKKYSDGGPIWINQNKILFYSIRPINKNKPDELINDLWICEKIDSNWCEPYCLNFSQYTRFAVSPSITNSGTIYFVGYADSVENNMGIYYSILGNSGYEKPKFLPSMINSKYFDWTPFIAYDESYLIFSSNRPESKYKNGDLYISFKDKHNNWSEPIHMGDKINTDKQERFPSVSKELGILFFTRATDSNYDDIFWIDSKIIEDIRERQIKHALK
ncbi:hypothetical protein [Marinifilum fragile]|uniref:hypothetical protein n=1 Tax=Marinifilum fragile TaxID=570161 RepID=UPI002AA853AD|nr:hypothetical protein [Marinifilum fragile]